jgi:tetratricopeptide (TPR) repeat protein
MKKIAILAMIASTIWSCSIISQNYKLGTEAALNKNWDEAIKYYERAAQEDSNSPVYRLALFRAKISASYTHLHEARKLAYQGRKEEALVEYEKALSYDPCNRAIAEEVRNLTKEEAEEEKQEIAVGRPIKLDVTKEKINIKSVIAAIRSIDWASLSALNIRYIGYIVSSEKIIALIILDGNILAVEKGEMISKGVKIGEITPEVIEVLGPDLEKKKYFLEEGKK